jgi:hypothetical protein
MKLLNELLNIRLIESRYPTTNFDNIDLSTNPAFLIISDKSVSGEPKYTGAFVFNDEDDAYDFKRNIGEIAGIFKFKDAEDIEADVWNAKSFKQELSLANSGPSNALKDKKVIDLRK